MIPGEFQIAEGEITLNALSEGLEVVLEVSNTGDRPIQVGSHYHFYEVNPALTFARESARGMRLELQHPKYGPIPALRNPLRFSDTPLEFEVPPPQLGEHTQEVLHSLGMDASSIEALRSRGVL